MRHLAVDWIELCRRVGARGDVAGAGAALLGRWAEQHRGYHDLAHLDEVLARVTTLAAEADDVDTVRLAAWFHDAVYDPAKDDNEEQSAELATTTLSGLDVAPSRVADVARLVRLTATHGVTPEDRDGAVLCDADLAILAADELRYTSYVEGVRREYEHVEDAAFAAGRARVLASLLEHPTLFRTEHGRAHWEERARANAGAELERLRAT